MITILGIFDDAMAARRAFERLRESPLEFEDISVISRATESGAAVRDNDHLSAGEGAAIGAAWGGLFGLATLLIPGVGPFIAGGTLFAALTGAATGAVVGGIAGALMERIGISAEEAHQYEQLVQAGKTLMAVKAREEDVVEVRRILTLAGAEEVHDGWSDQVQAEQPAAPRATPSQASAVYVAMYDEQGKRVNIDEERAVASQVGAAGRATGHRWTSGEWVGEGQGGGPRTDTGTYDAHQWVGEGQSAGQTPGETWTSGEWVGEGQGGGPRTDTGTYDTHQWVGKTGDEKPKTPTKPVEKPKRPS